MEGKTLPLDYGKIDCGIIGASTDGDQQLVLQQRVLLGNIVDEGGGVDFDTSTHQQWRSPMRVRNYL